MPAGLGRHLVPHGMKTPCIRISWGSFKTYKYLWDSGLWDCHKHAMEILLKFEYLWSVVLLLIFLIYFYFFRAPPSACGSSQTRGRIGAIAAGLHHSHSNSGSLTHWARPGIEPVSSWILIRFSHHCVKKGTPGLWFWHFKKLWFWGLWFSKCVVPKSSASASPGNLLELQTQSCFNKPSKDFWCTKCLSHWYRLSS